MNIHALYYKQHDICFKHMYMNTVWVDRGICIYIYTDRLQAAFKLHTTGWMVAMSHDLTLKRYSFLKEFLWSHGCIRVGEILFQLPSDTISRSRVRGYQIVEPSTYILYIYITYTHVSNNCPVTSRYSIQTDQIQYLKWWDKQRYTYAHCGCCLSGDSRDMIVICKIRNCEEPLKELI